MSDLTTVIKKFQDWKADNPDEDYQYDMIDEFYAGLTRGELLRLMNDIENIYNKQQQ